MDKWKFITLMERPITDVGVGRGKRTGRSIMNATVGGRNIVVSLVVSKVLRLGRMCKKNPAQIGGISFPYARSTTIALVNQ